MKRYIILICFLSTLVSMAYGQKERKYIRHGNKYYQTAVEQSDSTGIDSLSFVKAEEQYRMAQEKRPDDFKASYNIGNAQFKQGMMPEAAIQFEEAIELAANKEEKALAYYNYGDALLGQQKFDESIEAFKNALRNNPSDMEAKYNLEFARKMKEQQQQQQQQNQDQNQDQKSEPGSKSGSK
jgi:Ca-activated chloride channel homolog